MHRGAWSPQLLGEAEFRVASSRACVQHITDREFHHQPLGARDIADALDIDDVLVRPHPEMRGAKRGRGKGVA